MIYAHRRGGYDPSHEGATAPFRSGLTMCGLWIRRCVSKKVNSTENKEKKMSAKILLLLSLIASCVLLGCGGDDPITPGEEVVADKWKEPKDIGKVYAVEEPKHGDTVTLDTGEKHTIGKWDIWGEREGGLFLTSLIGVPDPRDPNAIFVTEEIEKGFVVPEGPPIVSLLVWFDTGVTTGSIHVTKDRNVINRVWLGYNVRIDRVLDYALPIYLEYQLQDRAELGGGFTTGRFVVVVPKGKQSAIGCGSIASYNEHVRSSVSVLPYTDMQKLDLPIIVGYPPENNKLLPLEYRGIPEGHTFRPYRIRSSSFVIGETGVEGNW